MDQVNQITSGSSSDPVLSLFSGGDDGSGDGGSTGLTLSASLLSGGSVNLLL